MSITTDASRAKPAVERSLRTPGSSTLHHKSERVMRALRDARQTVVFLVAPRVRASLTRLCGLAPGPEAEGRLLAALRRMGAARIFDAGFAADLAIMEGAAELLRRLDGGASLPLVTGACPDWVALVEQGCPELLAHLSTCRSPQQMGGALVKNYCTDVFSLPPDRVFCIAVAPCTARVTEAMRPEFACDGMRDVDAVLTVHDLAQLLRAQAIDLGELPDELYNRPFGESSAAASRVDTAGGMADAIARTAHFLRTGDELAHPIREHVHRESGFDEITVALGGQDIRLAIVNGMVNVKALIERFQRGDWPYHLIEVNVCAGGCITGPPADDAAFACEQAHQNPSIQRLYGNLLESPGSEIARMALHTAHV